MSVAEKPGSLSFRIEMMGPEPDQYPVIVHDGGDRAAPFNRDGMRSTIIPPEWRTEATAMWNHIERLESLAEDLAERCAKQATALAKAAEKQEPKRTKS